MRRQLHQLAADNRADSLLTNDSLAFTLTNYFDRHGTANERLLAHYLLGRTHYDRGELTEALEAYHDAADCADTTRQDCDYATLSRVHAQMATLFRQHYQSRTALKELSEAQRLAYKGRDTLMAIECYFEQAAEYERLGQPDSALFIAGRSAQLFTEMGQPDRAAAATSSTTLVLLDQHRLAEAKAAIDAFLHSAYTDAQGNVSPGREIFYYKRGRYYLQTGQLDSAEYFFRKELRDGRNINNQIAGRKGLQLLYERLGRADSVAKYAAEGYNLSDSVYILSESQNMQSLQAMFDYTQNQLMVVQKTSELKTTKIRMAVVVISLLVVIGILVYIAQRRERRRALETAQYRSALEQLSQAQADLMLLHEEANTASTQAIAQKNQQIKALQEQVNQFQQLKKDYHRLSLEDRLANADVSVRLRALANDNPPRQAAVSDIKELKMLINDNIPAFFDTVSPDHKPLSELEYTVCLLTRLAFPSSQVDRLNGVSEGYTSTLKSRIFKKVTGQSGTAKDFERWIAAIK
jgi:tetratricopeptide (TPR) repeat protein